MSYYMSVSVYIVSVECIQLSIIYIPLIRKDKALRLDLDAD